MFITRKSQTQFLIQDSVKRPKVRISLGPFKQEPLLTKESDLVLVAQNKGYPQNWEKLKKKPFLINSPGEYEVKDVAVQGIQNNGQILYLLSLGQEKLAYFLHPSQKDLTPKQMDKVEEAKFLLISLDGQGLGPDKISTLISQIAPQLVIPMDYEPHHLKRLAEILSLKEIKEEASIITSKLPLMKEETLVRALSITS